MPLVLHDVTKRFRSTTAVRSVSWAPPVGRVSALVGLNGAGKSTLMRLMCGLVRPTAGTIRSGGSRGPRRPHSALIEAPALYGGLTVARHLRLHGVLAGADSADAAHVAELTRIGDVLCRRARTLSQGYRQRVAIAIAMLGAPSMLLLDEPTNALDPEAIVHLRGLLRRLADGGTAVVVSTHLLRELEGVADLLAVMHEGRLLYDGPFATFVGPSTLRIRARDDVQTGRLEGVLRDSGIDADPGGGRPSHLSVHAGTDELDAVAHRVFAIAAEADLTLVELARHAPTLEEAFQATISGARA